MTISTLIYVAANGIISVFLMADIPLHICTMMGTIFKVLLHFFLQYCFHFIFWFLGHKAYGILVPRPGIELSLVAMKSEVLVIGPLEKSLPLSVSNPYPCIHTLEPSDVTTDIVRPSAILVHIVSPKGVDIRIAKMSPTAPRPPSIWSDS